MAPQPTAQLAPLIVALDLDTLTQVKSLMDQLGSEVQAYKVGMKLYTRYGPEVLKLVKKRRKQIFLDLKFHDIPNTVAQACREATRHGVNLLTVHAAGGAAMLKAAAKACREAAKEFKRPEPLVLAVTVLTSMDDLKEVGLSSNVPKQVSRLAKLARQSGLKGVVCSPKEIALIRRQFPRNFRIVTPGIRPPGSARGDQKRVMTPEDAYHLGADSLVVGRPIYQAARPSEVVRAILGQSR